MNEEAEQALAQIIERAVDGIDGAVLFTQEHLPDVVQQLLLWHGIRSGIISLVGLFLLSAGLYYCIYVFKQKPGKEYSKDDPRRNSYARHEATAFFCESGSRNGMEMSAMFAVFPVVFGSIMLAKSLTLMQILIAPKLYLLEYAANLL